MAQLAIKYWLVSDYGTLNLNVSLADGTTLHAGNYFRVTNIDGLDAPALRASSVPRSQGDGDILLEPFRAGRYPTFQGVIVADSVAQADTMADTLREVLNGAVGADATLRWTRRDAVTRLLLGCRLWDGPRISTQEGEGLRKTFAFTLASPYEFVANDTLETVQSTTPLTSFNVTNDGDHPSPPLFRVYGNATTPTTAFTINNHVRVAGLSSTDLNATAEYVEIDTLARTVTHSDGRNLIDKLDVVASDLNRRLGPGVNAIQMSAITGGTPSKLEVLFRDAWIGG